MLIFYKLCGHQARPAFFKVYLIIEASALIKQAVITESMHPV